MTDSISRISLVAGFAAFCIAATMASCSSKSTEPTAPAAPAVTTPGNTAVLLGDMKPLVSVKELMKYMIDPASDYVFDSVKTLIRPDGSTVEIVPKTDDDWEKLRIGAITMAEGVYLLKVQRPLAPAGDVNNSVGADATELSPAEIAAKIKKDPVEWNARIEALRNVGLEVLDIVAKKNAKELWDASENLDVACEQCHVSYWYPKEDKEFYRKLDKKLHDMPVPKKR